MVVRMILGGVVATLLGGSTFHPAPVMAEERLSMRASPHVSFAPANLVIRATVLPDESHRAIEIIAESADFYRASEMPLDGDQGPRNSIFRFQSLPMGSYEVRAVLKGVAGAELASVRTQIDVIDGDGLSR